MTTNCCWEGNNAKSVAEPIGVASSDDPFQLSLVQEPGLVAPQQEVELRRSNNDTCPFRWPKATNFSRLASSTRSASDCGKLSTCKVRRELEDENPSPPPPSRRSGTKRGDSRSVPLLPFREDDEEEEDTILGANRIKSCPKHKSLTGTGSVSLANTCPFRKSYNFNWCEACRRSGTDVRVPIYPRAPWATELVLFLE